MFGLLLKKQLVETFKGCFYDAKRNEMRPKRVIAASFAFFAVVIFGCLGGLFGMLSLSLCGGMVQAGAGWVYFAVMAGLAIVLGTFGCVANSYSSLYLARDNDLLLSLPLPVREVVAARLMSAYLMGLLYTAAAFVPALAVYWSVARPGVAAAICGVALLFTVSLVVLCLSCMLGWAVARISLKLKNKSLVTVFLVLAGVALYYVLYFQASDAIKHLLVNAALYGADVQGAALVLYAFGSIGEGNALAMLLFLGAVGVLTVLVWSFVSRNYLRTATSTGAVKETRYAEKPVRQKSPFAALVGKELAKFLSSPNYMLNCGLGIVFMLIVGVAVLLNAEFVNEMVAEVWGGNLAQACVLFSGVLCLLAASNDIAAPSVSLEGKGIWMLQSLPVSPREVLRAKAVVHFALTVVPLAFVVTCVAVAVDLPLLPKLVMCFVPFACALLTTAAASYLGVKMANLSWTNEVVPIKQGGAAVISMFGGWGMAAVFTVPYFVLGAGVNAVLYMGVWALLFNLAAAWLLYRLDTEGSRAFATL